MRILLIIILSLIAITGDAATFASDGSDTDVQAKINAASDGDIVTIPVGNFDWTTPVTISGKGIHLKGVDGGWISGWSRSSVLIDVGLKTFTTQTGLKWTAGDQIGAYYVANGAALSMFGTVDSYSGSTLVINVTIANGIVSKAAWVFVHAGTSSVTFNVGASTGLNITEDDSHSVEVSQIHFIGGVFQTTGAMIKWNNTSGGKPILWHDNRITGTENDIALRVETNRGVIWSNYWDSTFYGGEGDNNAAPDCSMMQHKPAALTTSWTTADTLGQNDTDGTGNLYIEDSVWVGTSLQSFDVDEMARTVIRHSLMDNSGGTSHGRDTGTGLRHFQFYKNTTLFDNLGVDSYPLDYQFFIRGGTGIVCSNSIEDITSGQWGNKTEMKQQIQALRRACGNDCCWNAGWPQPRQIGQSHNGSSTFNDPLYYWQNSAAMAIANVDYAPDGCGGGPAMSVYCIEGRDFTNAVKTGWAPYVYPHNLRGAAPEPPGNAVVRVQKLRALRIPLRR